MKKIFGFLFISTALMLGCSKSVEKQNHLTHTYKLQRPFSVSFTSSNKLLIKKAEENKSYTVKIYLKTDKLKKLVEVLDGSIHEVLELNLPDDLSEYSYIIAVAETYDSNGNQMSSVDTYKIGEQELINEAKSQLKNRN